MDEVKKCVAAIVKNDKKFLVEHKDHSLSKNVRELHIDRQYNDDWLMYYRFNKKTKQLELILHNNSYCNSYLINKYLKIIKIHK